MFQDEAGFGRINKPKCCWCEKNSRPSVPCHHIREYYYAYGAVEPLTGESGFLVMRIAIQLVKILPETFGRAVCRRHDPALL